MDVSSYEGPSLSYVSTFMGVVKSNLSGRGCVWGKFWYHSNYERSVSWSGFILKVAL